jgi:hypothetical protein
MRVIPYLIIITLLANLGYADGNGIWHNAEDVRPGIFGDDEGLASAYSFINEVIFNQPIYVSTIYAAANNAYFLNPAGNSVLNTLSVRGQDTDARYQLDVVGSCSAGSFVVSVNDDGTVVCQAESDPTVPAHIKDGISWNEISGKPAGFADNIDNVDDADNDPTNELQNLASVLSRGNSAGNLRIANAANPVNNQDVATKNYVDSQIASAGGGGTLSCTTVEAYYDGPGWKNVVATCPAGYQRTGCSKDDNAGDDGAWGSAVKPSGANGCFCGSGQTTGWVYCYAYCCRID